ncbi:MAG: dynamin family protein [Clostridiales bacterium]|jgi:ribosome biogenesis GTPase A|nr:dynamin family protein [Clostridiales bacterium]
MKEYPTKQIEDMAHRIYARPFRIGAFGKMKTGKSSILNAILGMRLLPVKSITATAVRTNIHHAEQADAEVIFKNSTIRKVAIDDAKNYIVHAYGKTSEASEVNLRFPLPFTLRNSVFVDTPGIDDLAGLNEVSEKAIGKIDLAVLVFDATRFISSAERKFCVELNEGLSCNVIFVINKTDSVEFGEVRELANVYLRTYGIHIVGSPKVLYTATPENGLPCLDGLSELLSRLVAQHHRDISRRSRNRQLAKFVSAQLDGLIAYYSVAVENTQEIQSQAVLWAISRGSTKPVRAYRK